MMKRAGIFVLGAVGLCLTLAGTRTSHAHTVTQGFVNAGPGSVTFWFGSYHFPSENPAFSTEGSFQLVGINGNPFPTTVVPFTLHTDMLPAGLVEGDNYFVDPSIPPNDPNIGFPAVRRWQGATFTGLSPGDYRATYIPIANPTVTWAPWSEDIRTFDITLEQEDVDPTGQVPEPASLAIWSLGLLGLGAVQWFRSRRSK